MEDFFYVERGGEGEGEGWLSHCFQGNGGYKSSLTEFKGEAIDRKSTTNEEGS